MLVAIQVLFIVAVVIYFAIEATRHRATVERLNKQLGGNQAEAKQHALELKVVSDDRQEHKDDLRAAKADLISAEDRHSHTRTIIAGYVEDVRGRRVEMYYYTKTNKATNTKPPITRTVYKFRVKAANSQTLANPRQEYNTHASMLTGVRALLGRQRLMDALDMYEISDKVRHVTKD